jgi:DNA-binding MarR family transcriptional regulator
MEERGLLKRQRSGEDRRVVELTLLPEGKKTVESLIHIVVDFYNDLLDDFTREEVDQIVHLLTRLVGKLDAQRKEA